MSETKVLWVWGDALLVLDLGFDIVNCVQGFDLKSNCLTHSSIDMCVQLIKQHEIVGYCTFSIYSVVTHLRRPYQN